MGVERGCLVYIIMITLHTYSGGDSQHFWSSSCKATITLGSLVYTRRNATSIINLIPQHGLGYVLNIPEMFTLCAMLPWPWHNNCCREFPGNINKKPSSGLVIGYGAIYRQAGVIKLVQEPFLVVYHYDALWYTAPGLNDLVDFFAIASRFHHQSCCYIRPQYCAQCKCSLTLQYVWLCGKLVQIVMLSIKFQKVKVMKIWKLNDEYHC